MNRISAAVRLDRLISKGGPITFAKFMREALYGRGGYYQRAPRVGEDYHTAPRISPLFGRLLARLPERLALKNTTVVEFGAHDGRLARHIIPALPATTRYVAIETSSGARVVLRQSLHPFGRRAMLCDSAAQVPRRGDALVICNELFDALPCHRVRQLRSGLRELYVDRRGSRFFFRDGPLSSPRLQQYLQEERVALRPGRVAEICLETGKVYRAAARTGRRVALVAFDYGFEAPELYLDARRTGTLRSYARQRLAEDVLANPGDQDLTYDVDFTRLGLSGRRHGFALVKKLSQAEFLLGLGALDLMQSCSVEERLSLKSLLIPGGMGDRFSVLVQARGLRIDPSVFPTVADLARRAGEQ